MKAGAFTYHAPETIAEVVQLTAEYGDEAKLIAGGQSLVPILALRLAQFAHLVDINRVESLSGIERKGEVLRIGATTRQRALERDPQVAVEVPLLASAAPLIGHFQIRNRGTVGGSLAHADPASELPAVAVAVGARFEVVGPGGTQRTIDAEEFFRGTWTTSLAVDEVLTAVEFPRASAHSGCAVDELARRHGDFAIAGAAVTVQLDDTGVVQRSGIGLFGVAPTPVRAAEAEAALRGHALGELNFADIGQLAASTIEPPDDIHATAAQRRRIIAHLVARAARRAITEAERDA